jgi:tetratricopeptide (TPR) repeat protein
MQRTLLSLVIASLVVAGPGTSQVASAGLLVDAGIGPAVATEDSFESLTEQASQKFRDKEYDAAVALFEQAYALNPEPNILFNIGRIYEEAGKLEDAIVYYERFVTDPQVDLDSRQKALRRRDVAREIVEIKRRDEAKRRGEEEQKPPPVEVKSPDPVFVPTEVVVDDPPRPRTRSTRPIGWALVGTGGAALIGGFVVGGVAKRYHRAFSETYKLEEARDFKATGLKLAPAADALFIAGGILAAAGIVILLLPQSRRSSKKSALLPQVTPNSVGVGVFGRF